MAKLTVRYDGSTIVNQADLSGDSAAIGYNGQTIATCAAGQTKTLPCTNKFMQSNLTVGNKTLQCANKMMTGDVAVIVEGSAPPVGDYTYLEYVDTDGSQIIAIPVYMQYEMVLLDFEVTNYDGTQYYLLGEYQYYYYNIVMNADKYAHTAVFQEWDSNPIDRVSIDLNVRNKLFFGFKGVAYDGVYSFWGYADNPNILYRIAKYNVMGASAYDFCFFGDPEYPDDVGYRIYGLAITEQTDFDVENPRISLVPAKRNSDGAIGLYDEVNDEFYESFSDSPFIPGPDL